MSIIVHVGQLGYARAGWPQSAAMLRRAAAALDVEALPHTTRAGQPPNCITFKGVGGWVQITFQLQT